MINIAIKDMNETWTSTMTPQKYNTTAAANHSTHDTKVQYNPTKRLFLSGGLTIE